MTVTMYGPFFLRVTISFIFFCEILSDEIADHPSWKYVPKEECGYGASSDRIVGGKIASLGQFPWMARIGYKPKNFKYPVYLCAGSIINKWYVLTAVHCAIDKLGDTIHSVRLGENYVGSKRDCEYDVCAPKVQGILVQEVIKYDKYLGNSSITYGDIALIKLAKAIHFNDYVQPICLPRGKVLDKIDKILKPGYSTMEVAGWGMTDSISRKSAKKLLYVRLPVVDLETCTDIYYPNPIDDTHICVGAGMGKDSCGGDSGGPLMKPVALDSAPRYYIFGIVSYGMKWCGISAAVYTNVAYYLKWILDHIEK